MYEKNNFNETTCEFHRAAKNIYTPPFVRMTENGREVATHQIEWWPEILRTKRSKISSDGRDTCHLSVARAVSAKRDTPCICKRLISHCNHCINFPVHYIMIESTAGGT